MKKLAKKKEVRESQMMLGLQEVIRADLRSFVVTAGMCALESLLEKERTSLCGPKGRHDPERQYVRGGHSPGELVFGGRRVGVNRPRVHEVQGGEVTLPSWRLFSEEDPLSARAVEQMLIGVSTRRYSRSLEPLGAEVSERGASKSAVSRRFVAATQRTLTEWLAKPLDALDLCVLMLDGLHVGDHVLLVALGIDTKGYKHVLGVRLGATENSVVCTELLANLRDRGLPTNRSLLIVLDGGKGLRKAVREVFGDRAIVQRCQVHKARNVVGHLPESVAESVRAAMRQAYTTRDAKRARALLMNLVRSIRADHPDAAASLEEGLDETLTILRFGLSARLERALSNTNMIENLIGQTRDTTRRVKRWKDGQMTLRWVVAAVHDASKRFRRVWAYEDLLKLNAQLRALDEPMSRMDSKKKAA